MTTFTTEDRLSAVTIQYPERLLEQGSEAWKQARLGHVTASNVADVMAKGKNRRGYYSLQIQSAISC